ncbi:IS1 family transposase [Escherichia coli]
MGYVRGWVRQRWLFYAYDRLRKTGLLRASSVNALWRRWGVL